jgi:hypothetical protein
MPKVVVSLRAFFFKMIEFLNFRHFRSFLILAHLSFEQFEFGIEHSPWVLGVFLTYTLKRNCMISPSCTS